ncbi:MAG TPA: hypothetical protein ACFYEK_06185 [Candidatus Wunengus sp. YC60]|uniref:hypothetical protein n=1 Tax=Candidatus Wunengus sp. YC60 TaxID=3367697 RepID=UPI00402A20AC
MRVINVSEELVVRAHNTLYLEEAIKTIINGLVKEIVKSHLDVLQLWKDVETEATKQGIVKQPDEAFNFDYVTSKFTLTKK